MNWIPYFLFWSVGFFLGFAIGEIAALGNAQSETSMTLPQGACDPAKTQVLRMDGSEQITQVLDRGVNCVVVMK